MELDHVFVLSTAPCHLTAKLEGLGLTPSYAREHPGQGTCNICYAFDNAYLEVLWITNPQETQTPPADSLQLLQRADDSHACPFGLAWRQAEAPAFPCWDYRPPYLPDTTSIAVAQDSHDLSQPLMFRAPGGQRPDQWPATSPTASPRQADSGFDTLEILQISLPHTTQPSVALQTLSDHWGFSIKTKALSYGLVLAFTGPGQRIELQLP